MTDEFNSALRKIADGALPLQDVAAISETLSLAGRTDLSINLYRSWIGANFGHELLYAAHFNLSAVLTGTGRHHEALAALETVTALNPSFLPAYSCLGQGYEAIGAKDKAVTAWNRLTNVLGNVTAETIALKSDALDQMGRIMRESGFTAIAEKVFRQELAISPAKRIPAEQVIRDRMVRCDWPAFKPSEGLDIETQIRACPSFLHFGYVDDPLFHLASTRNRITRRGGYRVPRLPEVKPSDRTFHRRIRVGYLSSDLREHASGYLTAEMFEIHDKSKIEVFLYCTHKPNNSDTITARIRSAAEHWTDISGLSDIEASNVIRNDGIDILVDMNGHTSGDRLNVVAMCPAPVNVNWLGFPGSMATPYHHYIIADNWTIPPENEIFYSEKVLRLPCYQPNDRKRIVSDARPTRADAGLPENKVVFSCLCAGWKITEPMFERWMTIMAAVPDSVLWLLETGSEFPANILSAAKKHGINEDRLIFAKPVRNRDHLARLPLADLFLDTFPCGSHTTASDALWMNVPILALAGRSFASRVCGSLLHASGIPDLICLDPKDYVSKAVALARDKTKLSTYSERLRKTKFSQTLFNTDIYVSQIEDLYFKMIEDFVAGRLPQPDLRNLDIYFDIGSRLLCDVKDDHIDTETYATRWRDALSNVNSMEPIPFDSRMWRHGEH